MGISLSFPALRQTSPCAPRFTRRVNRQRNDDPATTAPPPAASGGGGGDAGKRAALAERCEKDDLVGKILALYAARGQDAPIGLAASPLETLKKHHASLKGADAAAAAARKEARARDVVSKAI